MKVKVAWATTSYYDATVEVDDADDDAMMNAAIDAAERNLRPDKQDRVIGLKFVEDSRNVVLPDVQAKQHAPDWED